MGLASGYPHGGMPGCADCSSGRPATPAGGPLLHFPVRPGSVGLAGLLTPVNGPDPIDYLDCAEKVRTQLLSLRHIGRSTVFSAGSDWQLSPVFVSQLARIHPRFKCYQINCTREQGDAERSLLDQNRAANSIQISSRTFPITDPFSMASCASAISSSEKTRPMACTILSSLHHCIIRLVPSLRRDRGIRLH
jgi:hypothetical protein